MWMRGVGEGGGHRVGYLFPACYHLIDSARGVVP